MKKKEKLEIKPVYCAKFWTVAEILRYFHKFNHIYFF